MMKRISSLDIKSPSLLEPSPELEAVQKLMPISDEDRSNLKADVLTHGIRQPISVYETPLDNVYFIIGGKTRWKIAQELHFESVPVEIWSGSSTEYRDFAIADNLNRRHLSPSQKRALVDHFLKIDSTLSDRAIAEKAKVSHCTVAKRRVEVESGGQTVHLRKANSYTVPQDTSTKRTGKDGKLYSVVPKSASISRIDSASTDKVIVPEQQKTLQEIKKNVLREFPEARTAIEAFISQMKEAGII